MGVPEISVIIPIYNDELYLIDTLKSIQQQTFTNFECVCVNDGSTDRSEEIIDEFVRGDGRFLKINKENGGVSSARNAGLDAAKGEYVFFMDHDDLAPGYALQRLLDAAEKHNVNMSRGRVMMVADRFKLEKLPKGDARRRVRHFDDPPADFLKRTRRKYKSWCWVWQCLFKRKSIENVRFVEELRSGGEDNLFMFEVLRKIKSYVQVDDIVVCHRHSSTSVTLSGYNPALIKMFDTIIPYIYKNYANAEDIDRRLLKWFYRKEAYSVYRFLVIFAIRSNQQELLELSRKIFVKYDNTPELNELVKHCFRLRVFYRLFIRQNFGILRKLKYFL